MNAINTALLADTALSSSAHPDAALIAICDAHQAKIDAVNTSGDIDGGPDDQAYVASRSAISAARPRTMDGVRAIARAAKAEARNLDGSEGVGHTPAEFWSMDIINALVGGVSNDQQPHLDLDVLELCAQHKAAYQAVNDCSRDIESTNDPLWKPYGQALDALQAVRPQTLDGFRTLAASVQTEVSSQVRFGRNIDHDLRADELNDLAVRLMWNLVAGPLDRPAAGSLHPDADLIRICAQHQVAHHTVNEAAFSTGIDCEDAPDWPIYNRSLDLLNVARPSTMDGCRAIAESIRVEATNPDGSVDAQHPEAVNLAWVLVQSLLAGPAPIDPDADLHANLAAFNRLQQHINALYDPTSPGYIRDDEGGDGERDRAAGAAEKAQEPLLGYIQRTRARTADGVLAKLRAAWTYQPEMVLEGPGNPGERILVSAMLDAVAMAPGGNSVLASQDTAIVAAADAFITLQTEADALWNAMPDGTADLGDPTLEAINQIEERQNPHVDAMCDTVATTAAAHRARAQAILVEGRDTIGNVGGYSRFILRALLRDLVGGEVRA